MQPPFDPRAPTPAVMGVPRFAAGGGGGREGAGYLAPALFRTAAPGGAAAGGGERPFGFRGAGGAGGAGGRGGAGGGGGGEGRGFAAASAPDAGFAAGAAAPSPRAHRNHRRSYARRPSTLAPSRRSVRAQLKEKKLAGRSALFAAAGETPRSPTVLDRLATFAAGPASPRARGSLWRSEHDLRREPFDVEDPLIAGKLQHRNASPRKEPNATHRWPGPLQIAKDQPFLTSLLLFVPVAYAVHFLRCPAYICFMANFIAIVPQAWLMGKATEDLAEHLGQVAGGLLNAWFGNVVEMLLCVAGLRAGEMLVVKATLVGSILSNLLLVAGCAFLFGGFKHKVQEFSAIGASTNASLMTLSCLCLGLPTLYGTMHPAGERAQLRMSRSVSFLLMFMYVQYLVFQLYTHGFLFDEDDDDEDDEGGGPDLSKWWAVAVLGCCTICCAFNSEFLINSIEGTEDSWNISKAFIGIILLPIIGNAAEHYTSVIVAMRNKMDLSLACAVGSSCQMALFVTPFTVLAGWALGQPMSLDLHAFEMGVLLLAVLIMTSILQDGYSNWLEGSMLVSAYCVIALIYFFEEPSD